MKTTEEITSKLDELELLLIDQTTEFMGKKLQYDTMPKRSRDSWEFGEMEAAKGRMKETWIWIHILKWMLK